jgi:endonuclease/exonuclease/phosphatase family metal-dependent hydrolase
MSCDPLVTEFATNERAKDYTAHIISSPPNKDTLTVATWNIRFGIGRAEWFGDSCGELVLFNAEEVEDGLELLAAQIAEMDADILLLQEVDIDSKRSAYIDQVQWLLDNTGMNYGVYASMWEVQFVPSDGLGRINTGNAILSKWPLSDAERIQLSLRGDQDDLTRAFYVRRNVLRAKVNYPGNLFWAVDIHASAFSNDDTKQKQYVEFKDVLDELNAQGEHFVAGGDLNELPPGAVKNNYCDNDRCPDEESEDDEGCDFSNETTWISALFDSYVPAVSLVISEQGTVVYVVKDGKAHKVPVRAFKERNDFVEIEDFTHQLKPETDLILRGSGAVFPGAKVFITNLETEPKSKAPFNSASKDGKPSEDPAKTPKT